ncbi:MAG: ACT domain-containing protein [Oscillospiraceae bacterium]|nr:ACT domain-containing protein [Oscillospiraceae bacterium]
MNDSKFVVVSTDVLPEVILKVLEAKRLIAQGICRTSTEACKMADVSRSAYYKYKDSVYLHSEKISRRVVTYHFVLLDQAGVLSEVLTSLYKNKANVLTINQNMPIDSAATVTITVRFDEAGADPEAVRELLEKTEGVAKVRILTTAENQPADE